MGGGLMQLVAYGAQDIYLTGNPQITFFKVVYRRYTNFAMEVIEQTVSGASTLTASTTNGTCTISRNGDLVGRVYVTSSTAGITDGDALVNQVDLEIGGQLIDRHYQEWMQVWAELTVPESKAAARKAMCGAVGTSVATNTVAGQSGVGMVQVPLQFWFCRNPGLALPLIALQYHEVKLKFTWGTSAAGSVGAAAACKVMVDYIYLDTDERRRFAQVSHEYLIEQVQRESNASRTSLSLNFNHPVKELVWVGSNYTNARLTLNGHDRIAAQEEEYFQLRQPFDHHTAVPGRNVPVKSDLTMLATHLPIGAADLTTANTFNNDATDIDNGVVSIATNNGSVARAGDLVKVTALETELLETPIVVTSGTAACILGTGATEPSVDNTFRVLTATTSNLKLFSTTATDIDINAGDVLLLSYPVLADSDTGVGDESISINVVVDDIVTNPSDEGVAVYTVSFAAGMIAAADTPVASIAGAGSITVVSRLKETFVGISSVATANTNGLSLTLTDTAISVTQNFKVHILGRQQTNGGRCTQLADMVNVYSFALNPEEHQPSGTCNFSRIDSAHLEFGRAPDVASAGNLNIYAVNYNVLRIMSGMGGLAYSN